MRDPRNFPREITSIFPSSPFIADSAFASSFFRHAKNEASNGARIT